MKFSLFTSHGANNSKPVFEAFAESIVNSGHTVVYDSMNADVAVIWSVLWNGRMAPNQHVWNHYRSLKKDVVVLEVGGIHRETTWKVGLNGISKDCLLRTLGNNSERAEQLGMSLLPWRKDGEFVLLCAQHEKSLQWQNMPRMNKWVMDTIDELQLHTKRPILLRPHPRCPLVDIERQYKNVYRQHPRLLVDTKDDYDLAFDNVWAVINWSSTPAVKAVCSGVPVFVGPTSLAADVGNLTLSDIENPLMPERSSWFNDLAHTEYTVEEIRSGLPLKNLTFTA